MDGGREVVGLFDAPMRRNGVDLVWWEGSLEFQG